ncbi:rhomboid family intramembrane serine protease [Sphingomonas soli]|uniref:rhomboid family intramembrane serine protease n=1 Tax=Sphingomonas soli TaxID=266127 RepID=UPI000A07A9D0|nr:rhomboid family intramembrane serine protease [Sphingomonas soli]
MHLPRGRFTDALIALAAFAAIFAALAVGLGRASMAFGFMPAEFLAGGWQFAPVRSWLSPLASAFLPYDIISALFTGVLLLISGRYVEKSLGPVGLGVLFVAGAYAGAAARLFLTPSSPLPSAGLSPSLFAIVGAYMMLYGVPRGLPVPQRLSRPLQIGVIALFWLVIQLVFSLAARSFEVSVSMVDPLGGLVAGILLAKPLLAWRWRKA